MLTLVLWQCFHPPITKLEVRSHPSGRQHVVFVEMLPQVFFTRGGTVTQPLYPASEFPKWLLYTVVFCSLLWTWIQWNKIITVCELDMYLMAPLRPVSGRCYDTFIDYVRYCRLSEINLISITFRELIMLLSSVLTRCTLVIRREFDQYQHPDNQNA